jgi:predicted DNA binding CopG/RHH family protein
MNDQKTEDLKTRRITVRISGSDLEALQHEANRRHTTLGAVVRDLIRATKVAAVANGTIGTNGTAGNGHTHG